MQSESNPLQEMATLPAGFKAAGVCAGIKRQDRKDLALLVSDVPATAAAVFTTNQVKAATVKLCRERILARTAQAIVVNSGIANACTGRQGVADARQMAAIAAHHLGLEEELVYPCSTGSIGVRLPMPVVEAGIAKAATLIRPEGGDDAAEAIMTTDTFPKCATATLRVNDKAVRVTGIAKGAGMIEPNMATMLAFLLTDAAVEPAALQTLLSESANTTFNRVTVDGDRSTNDTALFLANGKAANRLLTAESPEWAAFAEAVRAICFNLAIKMVRDGEGASKVVTVSVRGAATPRDAEIAARSVANSLLVKTSWVGSNPNWGRVMDALGYSEACVAEEKVDIDYDEHPACRGGVAAGTPIDLLRSVVAKPTFRLSINLNLGEGTAIVYGCDCTEEYVRINM